MNDSKFVESKLKVIASEELQEEVDKELEEELEEGAETAISSVLDNPDNKCCGGGKCKTSED
jgi:hypothetical protein